MKPSVDYREMLAQAQLLAARKRAAREAAAREAEQARLEAKVPASEPDQITVGQLKALLSEYPDDMLVQTEGCDCNGPCNGVDSYAGELLLTRGR